MTASQHETKIKILEVASELFSKYGFNGTSVRDIAQASEVNIAAINYHFGSKHNLYWAVVQQSHQFAEGTISDIANKAKSVEELVTNVFHFLMENQASVRTAMRIMMTDGVPEPEGELRKALEATKGPPGAESFMEVLRKSIGKDVSDEALYFGVKSLFGAVFHTAIICSCSKKNIIKNEPFIMEPLQQLLLTTRAICEYLKSHPNLR